MATYKTFVRSATTFEQMRRARKTTIDTGLTYDEANRACQRYNSERTPEYTARKWFCEYFGTLAERRFDDMGVAI